MDLYPFQWEAVEFLGMEGGIYADPPGTGKTPATLSWLRQRQEPEEITALVVPKVMLGHWQREARLWYPELEVVPMVGTPKARARARDRAGRLSGESSPTALLATYEGMRSDVEELLPLLDGGILVCDEAHRLKNRNAQVTKAAARIARKASTTALLTGTPVMNGAEELWSLLRLLDPKRYTSFWRWVHYYFEVEITTFNYRSPRPVTLIHGVLPHRMEELRAEVAPYMIHRPLRDLIPDLPPLLHSMVPVTLGAKERKAYDGMAKYAWAEIEGTIVQAPNDVAVTTRLRQLASEWGVFSDGEGLGAKGHATVELVRSLVEQGEQVVVLTAFKETAGRIALELGRVLDVRLYTGATDQHNREATLFAFREGEVDVVVGTLATMGEGVDGLQVARHLVMVDRDWTPARNDQAIGRLLRRGQERPVTVHHVYAEDTIDDDVAQACASKQEVADLVMGRLNPDEVKALVQATGWDE